MRTLRVLLYILPAQGNAQQSERQKDLRGVRSGDMIHRCKKGNEKTVNFMTVKLLITMRLDCL